MIRKTISMPDEMGEFIEQRVKSGQYGNESEFVRDLLRKEQERLATIAKFQNLIDEGRASGVGTRTVEEIWDEAMIRHQKRLAAE